MEETTNDDTTITEEEYNEVVGKFKRLGCQGVKVFF